MKACLALLALGILTACSGSADLLKLGKAVQPIVREVKAESGSQDSMIFMMGALGCQRFLMAADQVRNLELAEPLAAHDAADERLEKYRSCVAQMQTTRDRSPVIQQFFAAPQ